MNDSGKNKNHKNPRNVPVERFIWREGDMKIVHVPYTRKRNERKQESSRSKTEEPHKEGSE